MCFYEETVRKVGLFPRFFGPVVEAFKVVNIGRDGNKITLVPPVSRVTHPYKLDSWQRAKRYNGRWKVAGFYAFKSSDDALRWGHRIITPVVVRVQLRGILAEGYQMLHQQDIGYRAMWMRIDRRSWMDANVGGA